MFGGNSTIFAAVLNINPCTPDLALWDVKKNSLPLKAAQLEISRPALHNAVRRNPAKDLCNTEVANDYMRQAPKHLHSGE